MKKLNATAFICGFVLRLAAPVAAQDTSPYNPIPQNNALPTNAVVSRAPPPPPAPPVALGAGLNNSPSPSTNFLALEDGLTVIPPDTHGAVGTNHLMVMLNTQVRIQYRDGTIISTETLSNWWARGGDLIGTIHSVFDPRVLYDPYYDRWIATAGADLPPNTFSSSIFIAVSATSDPTGVWYRNRVYVDQFAQTWADFPSIGFDRDKIAVQVNMYYVSNNFFANSRIFVFDKTNYYAGNYRNYTLITLNGTGGSQVPAVTYDTNVSTLYFVQEFATNSFGSGLLKVYSMTGAFGSEVITNAFYFPSAIHWNPQGPLINFAPQSGSTNKIHAGDSRMHRVVYRNGSLWCAHTVFPTNAPARSAVQWWQLNTNGLVVRQGRIDDSSGQNFYAYPSIAVNRFNDALIGYSSFSTNQYPSAAYSFRACNHSDNTFDLETIFKAGTSPYFKTGSLGTNRWGDYSATMPDPINDTDFWTIQEFATNYVGSLTNNSGRWCTWWGKVSMLLPGNDNFASSYVISNAIGSTNGTTVRATRESGEPNHAGNPNTPSVWYRWIAPTSGSTSFSAADTGTTFDTVVAIYTGASVGALTLVTNRHASGGTNVVFSAVAGTTYQIAIAAFNGGCGDFALSWVAPTAPMLLSQPQTTNCVANANENALFSVVAIGTPNPVYQWRFKGTNSGAATTNIAGATNTSYTIVNVQTNHAGDYSVVATNSAGSVTSSIATLFVHGDSSARLNLWGYNTTSFWFQIYGLTNRAYVVQTSTNLNSPTNWYAIYTNFVSYYYTNFNRTSDITRFYRAITNN